MLVAPALACAEAVTVCVWLVPAPIIMLAPDGIREGSALTANEVMLVCPLLRPVVRAVTPEPLAIAIYLNGLPAVAAKIAFNAALSSLFLIHCSHTTIPSLLR